MSPSPGEAVSPPEIQTFEDLSALSEAAARQIVGDARAAVSRRDYAIALAGGSTPRRLYELLAREAGRRMPWDRTHVFWGDERFVPHDHPDSNYGTARETLLRHVDLPDDQIHPVPTGVDSSQRAARIYEETLREFFASRERELTFDLVLLGLGEDGHTASLFPENRPRQGDEEAWVLAVEAPERHRPAERITLTLPILNTAWDAFFLVAGAEKREAFHRVTQERDRSLPAAHVRPRRRLVWFVDEAANPAGLA